MKIKLKCLSHFKGEIPKYQTAGSSGFDVRAQLEKSLILKPFERTLVPTGLVVEVPRGYEVQARPRSGLAIKEGLTLLNTPGTIDSDYRGEIKIIVINLGQNDIEIQDQDRIAQLVVCPVIMVQFDLIEEVSQTSRSEGGFGSTGKT